MNWLSDCYKSLCPVLYVYSTYHLQCSSFFSVVLDFYLVHFPSVRRTSFNISCSSDLLVMDPFMNFCLKKFLMCLDLSRLFSLGIEFRVGSLFFFNTSEILLHFHINFAFLPDLNMYFFA